MVTVLNSLVVYSLFAVVAGSLTIKPNTFNDKFPSAVNCPVDVKLSPYLVMQHEMYDWLPDAFTVPFHRRDYYGPYHYSKGFQDFGSYFTIDMYFDIKQGSPDVLTFTSMSTRFVSVHEIA